MTRQTWMGGLVAGLALATVGLGASGAFAQVARPAGLTFERSEDSPYLVLHWNCKQGDARSLLVEGMADVPVHAATRIYRAEVTLVGLDAAGRRVSRASAYLPPVLSMQQSAPFSVALGLSGTEARVDLDYSYDLVTNRGTDRDRRSEVVPQVLPVGLSNFSWSVAGACPVQ